MNRFYPILFIMMLTANGVSAQQSGSSAALTTSEAAQLALRQVPGRVLKVTIRQNHYRVKVLKDSGRVVVIIIDSGNGQIIRIEGNNPE